VPLEELEEEVVGEVPLEPVQELVQALEPVLVQELEEQ
jgi:hypothetical protein